MGAVTLTSDIPTGWFKYPQDDTFTSASALSVVLGHNAISGGSPPIIAGTKYGPFDLKGSPGIKFQILGAGADNATGTFKVLCVTKVYLAGVVVGVDVQLFAHGTYTLSAAITPGGVAASASIRIADTIATTLDTYGTAVEAAFGSPGTQTLSPTGNVAAMVIIPHLGVCDGVIVETIRDDGNSSTAYTLIQRS